MSIFYLSKLVAIHVDFCNGCSSPTYDGEHVAQDAHPSNISSENVAIVENLDLGVILKPTSKLQRLTNPLERKGGFEASGIERVTES